MLGVQRHSTSSRGPRRVSEEPRPQRADPVRRPATSSRGTGYNARSRQESDGSADEDGNDDDEGESSDAAEGSSGDERAAQLSTLTRRVPQNAKQPVKTFQAYANKESNRDDHDGPIKHDRWVRKTICTLPFGWKLWIWWWIKDDAEAAAFSPNDVAFCEIGVQQPYPPRTSRQYPREYTVHLRTLFKEGGIIAVPWSCNLQPEPTQEIIPILPRIVLQRETNSGEECHFVLVEQRDTQAYYAFELRHRPSRHVDTNMIYIIRYDVPARLVGTLGQSLDLVRNAFTAKRQTATRTTTAAGSLRGVPVATRLDQNYQPSDAYPSTIPRSQPPRQSVVTGTSSPTVNPTVKGAPRSITTSRSSPQADLLQQRLGNLRVDAAPSRSNDYDDHTETAYTTSPAPESRGGRMRRELSAQPRYSQLLQEDREFKQLAAKYARQRDKLYDDPQLESIWRRILPR